MVIAVMVLAALVAFAMPASASGDPGAGCPVNTLYHDTINGSVYFEHKGVLSNPPMTETFIVPNCTNIKLAKIYTGFWGGSPGKGGKFNITVNNYTTMTYQSCDPCPGPPCNCYPNNYQNDNTRCNVLTCVGVPPGTAPFNSPPNPIPLPDDIHGRISGCNVQFISFNATSHINQGSNTITVRTCKNACAVNCSAGGWDGRIYLIALLVVYEDNGSAITYWIDEGAAYMETGSGCDGPLNHLTSSYYFNDTTGTGMIPNAATATYEVLGWPHVFHACVPGVSSTKLNGINIGCPNFTGFAGGWDVYVRYDNILNNSYLNANGTNNFMDYWDSAPGYERSHVSWIVAKAPAIDLVPEVPQFPRMMRPNKTHTINVSIKNQGSEQAGSFNVSLYVNDSHNGTRFVSGLAGGASTTVNFIVNLPYGCYNFTVVADCNGQVNESNENNNNVTRKYQVGHYIVVDGNADFVALAADPYLPPGSVYLSGGTYYIQNLDIENCPDWGEKQGYGILIENTTVPFVITNCTIHDCGVDGVRLRNLVDGKVNDSRVDYNHAKGIRVINCSYVEIEKNIARYNDKYGIDVYMDQMPTVDSKFINITGNILKGNQYGIELLGNNCSVQYNIIQDSTEYGMYMFGNGSKIHNNTINNSGLYGMKLDNLSTTPCFDNYIYQNDFINNGGVGAQAYDSGTTNTWNTPTPVSYYYSGGYYTNYSGNYWDDYTGSDTDGDGIGTPPYQLAGGAGANDSYPAMVPLWRRGDVNRDGTVDFQDALKAYNWGSGSIIRRWAADVNGDCTVDFQDFLLIYNGNFPCCPNFWWWLWCCTFNCCNCCKPPWCPC